MKDEGGVSWEGKGGREGGREVIDVTGIGMKGEGRNEGGKKGRDE